MMKALSANNSEDIQIIESSTRTPRQRQADILWRESNGRAFATVLRQKPWKRGKIRVIGVASSSTDVIDGT